MEANPRPATSARPVRQPILLGLFAGAGVAVGYLLAGVPAVELMSLVACLAGVALGPWGGALAGGLAEAVYSLGSPYGPAAPPLLAAQVLGVALPGVLGGVARPWLLGSGRTRAGATLAGALGLAAAAGFDVLTNIGIILGYGLEWRVVAAGAVVMALVHGAVTAAIFAAILPAAAPRAALLARGALRGGAALALAAVVLAAAPEARAQAPADAAAAPAPADTTATAAVDSSFGRRLRAPDAPPPAAAPAAPTGPAALGWKRELWSPFATQALNWLDWHSPRTTAVEAGVAGPALVMGEGGAGPAPLVTVDDVPWSTGHALADDPWLIPQQGLAWQPDS